MINIFNQKRNLEGDPEIRIIGPRSAGKTTYMAALARWPNAKPDSPIQSVEPYDDDTTKLVNMAEDILETGLALPPTQYTEDANDMPLYTLQIRLKPTFLSNPMLNMKRGEVRFQVSCREYAGEIFQDLRRGTSSQIALSSYLDDCANSTGLLLLLDGTAREDQLYSQAIACLQEELNWRLTGNNRDLANYKIAIAFAKADQARIWVNRDDIERFVNLNFFQTKRTLEKWSKNWRCKINYFCCSAFGMKGQPPKPNVRVESRNRQGTSAVIDKPEVWRPFGLIAPLYWLYTGQEDRRLREIRG